MGAAGANVDLLARKSCDSGLPDEFAVWAVGRPATDRHRDKPEGKEEDCNDPLPSSVPAAKDDHFTLRAGEHGHAKRSPQEQQTSEE